MASSTEHNWVGGRVSSTVCEWVGWRSVALFMSGGGEVDMFLGVLLSLK